MAEITLAQIRSKIQTDCDISEESFISDSELNSLINAAIRDVEAVIHTLSEDYYLSKAPLALVSGTSSYSMPSGVYADKIRQIQYDDGATKYNIERIRDLKVLPFIDTNEYYRYLLTNTASDGIKINLYPTSRETSSTNVYVWFIRGAKELSSDSDSCDVPEFINYVHWRTRLSVSEKERDAVAIAYAQKKVDDLRAEMIATLSDRVPDDNNKILVDTSFYWDLE